MCTGPLFPDGVMRVVVLDPIKGTRDRRFTSKHEIAIDLFWLHGCVVVFDPINGTHATQVDQYMETRDYDSFV